MTSEQFFQTKREAAIARALNRGGLAAARASRGLTCTELAARMNVTIAAVSFWESGKVRPRLGTARRLADTLGMTIDELVPVFAGCKPSDTDWRGAV